MKIAMVVPPWFKVPPDKYGGIEAVVSLLAEGLVDKGHEVTLFTISSSTTRAEKFTVFADEMKAYLDKPPSNFLNIAMTHSLASYIEISRGQYDIIHDHTWKEGLCSAAFLDVPVVHTLHSPLGEENKQFYSLLINLPNIAFVTISDYQQTCLPVLNYVSTIYNGIDLSLYPYSEEGDYLFYIGRFNPQKAPHLACEIAKRLGEKLILAGKVNEQAERDYFDQYIQPYLGSDIKFIGEVGGEDKMNLFSRGKGYLYPIQWDEPFGITMVEAMACGKPVVTFRRGSTPEVVADGVTGFVADTMDELVDDVKHIGDISPRKCRERVENMFTSAVMVDNYERTYFQLLGKK